MAGYTLLPLLNLFCSKRIHQISWQQCFLSRETHHQLLVAIWQVSFESRRFKQPNAANPAFKPVPSGPQTSTAPLCQCISYLQDNTVYPFPKRGDLHGMVVSSMEVPAHHGGRTVYVQLLCHLLQTRNYNKHHIINGQCSKHNASYTSRCRSMMMSFYDILQHRE